MAIEQIVNEEDNRDSGSREIVSTVVGCTTAATLGVLYGIVAGADSNAPPYWGHILTTLGSGMLGIEASAVVNTIYSTANKKNSRTNQDVSNE